MSVGRAESGRWRRPKAGAGGWAGGASRRRPWPLPPRRRGGISTPEASPDAAEAFALSTFFDFGRDEVAKSVADCAAAPAGPVGRVAWFVPHFETAHFAGMNMILRTAEHMRVRSGVAAVFVVIGAPDEATPRARIAEVFPALAAACEIVVLARINEIVELAPVDAAVATMWMTALAVLRLEGARRKLYFLQDWEPLFYPAGTTSSLVESSYRFGFHAICNTEPLAASYREYGGTAGAFVPGDRPGGVPWRPAEAARERAARAVLLCAARQAAQLLRGVRGRTAGGQAAAARRRRHRRPPAASGIRPTTRWRAWFAISASCPTPRWASCTAAWMWGLSPRLRGTRRRCRSS